ncbi:MAG: pyrimidine 5'-nucleotidase [Pseudomonadota bacterium]
MDDAFSHVTEWVFDLDNTLYPPSARLFDQIETRMSAWVMDALGVDHAEADRLRELYWRRYGTTLTGLMVEHGIDAGPYLDAVHDISFDGLTPDPKLSALIKNLPGLKIVYTNGPARYAAQVLDARGLSQAFEAVYAIEDANLVPKPEAQAFQTVFEKAGIAGPNAAMFEDDPRNLEVPHNLGMRTIHVAPQPEPFAHIHQHTDDLAGFLSQLADGETALIQRP